MTLHTVRESEWPAGLLFDEAWLRARRELVHQIEALGYWPSREESRRFFKAQYQDGCRLRNELMPRILDPGDAELFDSESFFAGSTMFRARVPLALTFGHVLGRDLAYLAEAPSDPAIGELCAAFNLGISLFDMIADTDELLLDALMSEFSGLTLQALCSNRQAADDLIGRAAAVEHPEVRVLLRIIAWFSCTLHDLLGARGLPPEDVGVWDVLTAAYKAEITSLRRHGSPSDWCSSSEAKSVLPFRVICGISTLDARGDVRAIQMLVDEIATVFWLADDLADVIDDSREGAANSLLSSYDRTATPYQMISELLTSSQIEDTARRLARSLSSAYRILDSLPQSDARSSLSGFIPLAVRNWIE